MKLLTRFFTSTLLFLFTLFLTNPLFATTKDGSAIIVVGSSYGDTCTTNIQCEKIDDTTYVCEKTNELIAHTGTLCREIPSSSSHTHILSSFSREYTSHLTPPKSLGSDYEGPSLYIYPFVNITKIQV